ncbi:MAG: S1 RNA-binding domain-containing protein [Candidatus Dojkabacteria bacterium]|nr:S1 RNA-binding domain-containing protein [Candidatus Dojkabacteria bacterium]MDQ7020908.1 S1 RNA-binding domain-containing protein [Candidatus Dojkabacteria bacterium]
MGKSKENVKDGTIFQIRDAEAFVDLREQRGKVIIGNSYLIMIIDKESKKELIATEKITNHLLETVEEDLYKKNDKVSGYIYQKTQFGLKVCFDEKYSGVIYANEIFKNYRIGEKVDLYIKEVRPDLKVTLSFQPIGFIAAMDATQAIVMERLKSANGYLSVSDKSSPELIKKVLGISKKKYKDAIGGLYRDRKILIKVNGIELI